MLATQQEVCLGHGTFVDEVSECLQQRVQDRHLCSIRGTKPFFIILLLFNGHVNFFSSSPLKLVSEGLAVNQLSRIMSSFITVGDS